MQLITDIDFTIKSCKSLPWVVFRAGIHRLYLHKGLHPLQNLMKVSLASNARMTDSFMMSVRYS
jgi:hypothetical protein